MATVEFTGDAVVGGTLTGFISDDVVVPPPPPLSTTGRFFQGYEWRYLFTDLDCVTTTFAQGITRGRRIVKALGQPTTIEGSVQPDDPRVNNLFTDGYPRVAPSKRLVFAFRRELGATPWVVRAAGIIMSPNDEGDVDVPLSHFTAYDPRKYLDSRPCMNPDGSLPDEVLGINYLAATGDSIITQLLLATIIHQGGVYIDAGPAFGGTVHWAGTIETTDAISFNVQAGQMIGEVWTQLETTGNLDIVLDPIYDPENRPGFTHELSIYNLAGVDRHDAVFGWDRMTNNVAHISRMHDATPGAFFNKVWYHAGAGGPGVPLTGPSEDSGTINGASVDDFGVYWAQQFFPSISSVDPTSSAVLAMAQQAIKMAKQGQRTLTLNPIPERAKIPLVHYDVGDRVPVYASKRLRVVSEGLQRVQSIPFDISDDGIENVAGIITSPDYRGAE